MAVAVAITATEDIVAEARPVRVKWINVINTGTASAVGTVELVDTDGAVLHTIRTGPRLDVVTNWNYFHYFGDAPHGGLRSKNGLAVTITASDNIEVEVEYE